MKTSTQLTQSLRKWMDAVMHRSMRDWSGFAKASGFSMPQLGILMRLHYRGNCGISDIRDHMHISTAAASQLVDRLVQSGLLERTENAEDRRSKDLALSNNGKSLIQKGIAERYQWIEALVETLSPQEQETVLKALPILIEAAQKIAEPRHASQ